MYATISQKRGDIMSAKKHISSRNFFIIWAIFGISLVLLASHFSSGLYARYSSNSSGSDNARVAKFDIATGFAPSSSLEIDLNFYDPDMLTDEIGIFVTSSSEVALYYDVTVTMPDAATYEWLAVTLDGDGPTSVVGNEFTFSRVNTFVPNSDVEYTHTISFEIKAEFQGAPPVGMTNIDSTAVVTVCAVQID